MGKRIKTALARTGEVRPVFFTVPQPALDGNAVCEYFGYRASPGALASLKAQAGFPEGIKPCGARGQERWNVEELDAYRLKSCLRASDASSTPRRWADNDPRRVRSLERAAARAAAASQRPEHQTTIEAMQ